MTLDSYQSLIALLEKRAEALKPDPEMIEAAIARCERYQLAHGSSSNDMELKTASDSGVSQASGVAGDEDEASQKSSIAKSDAGSHGGSSVASGTDIDDKMDAEDTEVVTAQVSKPASVGDGLSVANTVEESRLTSEQLEAHREVAKKHKSKTDAYKKRKLLKPGTEIQGYRILGLLGKGGMGQVYRALQISMNREVAFKVLSPRYARSKSFRTRFLREAHSAGRLHHRHLIAVHDVDETPDGMLFFSMELVEGKSVADIIDDHGPMDEAESVRIIKQTLEALSYAHERNIIHRDVKPDNIMLDGEGSVKVADLGLSRIDEEGEKDGRVTAANTMMGTPYYMSPEQSRDAHGVDHRTDLYSVGATLYHMICGDVPFDGETPLDVVVAASTEKLEFIDPQPSVGIKRFIQLMMAKEPQDRPENANVALRILERLEADPRASIGKTNSTKILVSVAIIALIAMLIIIASMNRTPSVEEEPLPPRNTPGDVEPNTEQSNNLFEQFYFDMGTKPAHFDSGTEFTGQGHGSLRFDEIAPGSDRKHLRMHVSNLLASDRQILSLQFICDSSNIRGPRARLNTPGIIVTPRGIIYFKALPEGGKLSRDRKFERPDNKHILGTAKNEITIDIVTDGQRATLSVAGHADKQRTVTLPGKIQTLDFRWLLQRNVRSIIEVK